MTTGPVLITDLRGGSGGENSLYTPEFQAELLTRLVPRSRPPVVTTLPANPGAGSEVYFLADPNNGPMWHLVFSPDGSAYPWWCVGGMPLHNEVEVMGTAGTTTSTTFGDLTGGTTAGPSVVAPLAGIYDVTVECLANNNTVGAFVLMAVDIQNFGSSDARGSRTQAAVASSYFNVGVTRRFEVAGARLLLAAKYRVSAGTGSFLDRCLSAIPVRVG